MEDDILYEKAIEILNPGRLYFAIKAMKKSPVKLSFDMGDLNLTSGAVSSLISIEGQLPEEVQAKEWLVPLEDLKIIEDLVPADAYYWENRALDLEFVRKTLATGCSRCQDEVSSLPSAFPSFRLMAV